MSRSVYSRTKVVLIVCCLVSFTGNYSNVQAAYQDTERFEVTTDLLELYSKWSAMENGILNITDQAVKRILPMAVRFTTQLDITDECTRGLLQLLYGLQQGKMWAVKMFDATGKPMGGQMSGTFSFYGSHTSCVNMINYEASDPTESFGGKYCLVRLKPPMPPKPKFVVINRPMDSMKNFSMKSELGYELIRLASKFYIGSVQLGICVPSICEDDDVSQIVEALSDKVGLKGHVHYCESSKDQIQLDWTQLTVIATLGVFFLLTVSATVLECWCKPSATKIGEGEVGSPTTEYMQVSSELSESKCEIVSSVTRKLIGAFSINTNSRKIFRIPDDNAEQAFSCLYGIKFFTMGWIISDHVISLSNPYTYRDGLKAEELGDRFSYQIMSSGTVSIDTFFFMTALLVSYEIVKSTDRKGIKSFSVPLQIVRRLWRRLPSVMMTLGFVTILPLLGSGPNWKEETGTPLSITQTRWWTVLLCITNFFPTEQEPLMHLWYISTDVQLFIVALLLLQVFYRWKRVSYIIMLLLALVSMFLSGFMVYFKDVLPVYIVTAPEKQQVLDFTYYGLKLPYSHISSYMLGMTLGIYFARNYKCKPNPKWLVRVGWLVALTLTFVPLFYPYKYAFGDLPSATESFVYSTFCRTTWTLGLFVMVYLCASNNGGVINEFLSWKPFIPLSRLTYLVYLLHVIVIIYFAGSVRGVMDAYGHMIVWLTAGSVSLSHLMAYIMKIFFEAPLAEIEKIVTQKVLQDTEKTDVKIVRKSNHTQL